MPERVLVRARGGGDDTPTSRPPVRRPAPGHSGPLLRRLGAACRRRSAVAGCAALLARSAVRTLARNTDRTAGEGPSVGYMEANPLRAVVGDRPEGGHEGQVLIRGRA